MRNIVSVAMRFYYCELIVWLIKLGIEMIKNTYSVIFSY